MKAMDTPPQVRPTTAVMTALLVIFKTSPPHQPEVLVRPKQPRMCYALGDSGGFRHNALGSHFYHQCAFSFSQRGMAASVSTVI